MPPPLRHLSKGLEAVCQAFREESTCVGSRSLESCTGMQPIYDDMRHTSSQQRESTGISFSEKPCVVVPVVRNAAALGCLLRLLPSMDIRMQDLAWCHMLYLIGCSGNLQIIVSGWHPEVTRAWLSALLSLLRRAAFRGTGLFCHEEAREDCGEIKGPDCDTRRVDFSDSPSTVSTPYDVQPPAEAHESRSSELPDAFPVMQKADGRVTNDSQDRPEVNKTFHGGSRLIDLKYGTEGSVDRRSWRLGVSSLLFGDTLAWGIWLAKAETKANQPIENKQSTRPSSRNEPAKGRCGGSGGAAFIDGSTGQSCDDLFVLQMIHS